MNICFVANFYKTYFFHKIAKELETKDITIFWITTNNKLHNFLKENYPKEQILYISKKNSASSKTPIGDFRINEIIYGDRTLRHEKEWPKEYLRNIQLPLFNFIKENTIRFVFGEITWAHEILLYRILSSTPELKATYLCPHTIRIPNNRFAFFKDEQQSELYEIKNTEPLSAHELNFSVTKPDYLAINDKKIQKSRKIKERLNRIRRYITRENIDPDDPTVISSRWKSLLVHAGEEINRETYRLINRIPFNKSISSQPYALVALHKQPEASIDVIGRYYEDQWKNILNIWRALPDNWLLLVKEHSNAIGDRPYGFYKKIKKLSNTIIIDEKSDSHEIILNSRAVFTVSGTIAYEAALLGRQSFTFAPCFFNGINGCRKITMESLITENLFTSTASQKQPTENLKAHILKNSFNGIISDPISLPSVIDDQNIKDVSSAFLKILK